MSFGAQVPPAGGLAPDSKAQENSQTDFSLWAPRGTKSKQAENRFKKGIFYSVIFLCLSSLGIFAGMMSWLGTPGKPLVFLILVTEQIDPAILPVSFGSEDHKALASSQVFDENIGF